MEFANWPVKLSNSRRWTRIRTMALAGVSACIVIAPSEAQQPPRAIPVEEPGAPVKAVPVDDPAPTPAPVRAQPVQDPNRPSGPDEDLFDYATLAFTQQDYKIALKPYSDYVRLYPNGRHAAESWFRLAECYRKTNQRTEAITTYNEVMVRHPRTESASSAAYRLGMYAYEAREFAKAASWFEITEKLSSNADIRAAASFNRGLSFKYAKEPDKAIACFKAVAASKSPNLQKEIETSLQELASLAILTGRKDEAANAFKQLLTVTKDNKVIGETLVSYGLLLNELGKPEEALKQFEKALTIPGLAEDKRALAVFGILQANYVGGDLDAAIKSFEGNSSTVLPGDLRPKQLLIVGTAYKKKKMYRQAIEVFLLLEKDHPDTAEALEAGYQKLICFFQLGDKDLPLFTERFEERYSVKYPKHEYLQMARLIRADWWFSKQAYPEAAAAFVGVDLNKVPEEVRSSVVYKKGFAEAEAGKSNDAINTLNLFLTDYPKDPNAPVALAQRGVAYLAVGSIDKALADFREITEKHPNSPAVEMALYQSARIKLQTRDFSGMIADYEALLKKFPKTGAAGEAWYYIGRGYFELGQAKAASMGTGVLSANDHKEIFAKALEPLRKAIAANRDEYLDKASQLLIAIQAAREDLDGLAKEVDTYLEARKDASISPKTLLTLGVRYYDRGNYRASARYLEMASTPDEPKNTDAPVWNYLGKAQLQSSQNEKAITSLDNYLAQTPDGAGWAEALLHKSRAMLNLKRFPDAMNATTEALLRVKEGRLKARLQMLQGDIADEQGDALSEQGQQDAAMAEWKKAAGSYIVISQIFVDPEITPEAAYKASQVLDKIGEKEKAEALRQQLKTKYPNYQPKDEESE